MHLLIQVILEVGTDTLTCDEKMHGVERLGTTECNSTLIRRYTRGYILFRGRIILRLLL